MAQMCAPLIAVGLLVTALTQTTTPNLDHWTLARTGHFTVITDGAAHDAERLARRFERLRLVFGRLWPTARVDAKHVIVVAPIGDELDGSVQPFGQRKLVLLDIPAPPR